MVAAIGLFLGFGTLLAEAEFQPYGVAAFGFLGVVLLHELHERAPRHEIEPVASFRKALFVALAVVFFAWAGAVTQADDDLWVLPYSVFILWLGRLIRVRKWPGRLFFDVVLTVLFVLPLPFQAVDLIEALANLYVELVRVWEAIAALLQRRLGQ